MHHGLPKRTEMSTVKCKDTIPTHSHAIPEVHSAWLATRNEHRAVEGPFLSCTMVSAADDLGWSEQLIAMSDWPICCLLPADGVLMYPSLLWM